MSRSFGHQYGRHQNGWDTPNHDYYAHLSRMERSPSVLTDVPHYPNVYMAFNNKVKYEDESETRGRKHHTPEVHKKVQVVETTITECDRNGNCVVREETIDVEADGYIQNKHKAFDLCKWKTFKM